MRKYTALNLVQQHPFIKRFVRITLGIFIVFLLLFNLPWQQNIKGRGILISLDPLQRDYRITAPVDGFLDSIYVDENQFVKKNQKLFKMKDLDSDYQNRLTGIKEKSILNRNNEIQRLSQFEENLEKQKGVIRITIEIYNKKIKQIHNTLDALKDQEIALLNAQRIENIHYKRSIALYKDGIESKRDLEVTQSSYLHTKAKLHQIVTKINNKYQDLNITHEEKGRFIDEGKIKINHLKNTILGSRNLANSLKQRVNKDSIALSRYLSSDIVSKSDGYVLRIYKNNENLLIKKGADILFFSPTVSKKAIRLKISDFNMPLIKEGLKVRIIFFGWPALQVSGWPKISHGTYAGIIHSIERISHEQGIYYAIVTEDPNDDPWPDNNLLKIGTQASLWVTLAVVPLWYEAWRLMMAQPPAMVEESEW